MMLFGATVFVGAFLVFQVQPLIGKFILPWFGSSTGVWATCMVFFQVMLLGGYAYAHLLASCLTSRQQGWCHLCLLGLALVTLPITPSEAWIPGVETNPTLGILMVLGASIGVPFLLLSSTGPLLQSWYARLEPGRSPYRLYALSNVGSVAALISYPFLIEPLFPLRGQTMGWSWTYGSFALLCGACAWKLLRHAPPTARAETPEPTGHTATVFDVTLWILLSACGSATLLATTNQLMLDVAAAPFIWIPPLVVYLLSFIFCFEGERLYPRPLFCALLPGAVLLAILLLSSGVGMGFLEQIFGYTAILFVCCMCCHGELTRLKPAPRQLTFFFLMVSLGGALGGMFVAIAAPVSFAGIYEYPLLLATTLLLTLLAVLHQALCRRSGEAEGLAQLANGLGGEEPDTGEILGQEAAEPASTSTSVEPGIPPSLRGAGQGEVMFAGLLEGRGRSAWLCWAACALTSLWGAKRFLVDQAWFETSGPTLLDPSETSIWNWGPLWQTYGRHTAFALCLALLYLTDLIRQRRGSSIRDWWGCPRRLGTMSLGISITLGLVSMFGALAWPILGSREGWPLVVDRNFYGVLKVAREQADTINEKYTMVHGRIEHGSQFSEFSGWPTTYYGPDSGIGLAIQSHPSRNKKGRQFRVGVVGLGAGTLAAYANASINTHKEEYARKLSREPADLFRYYEINPMVQDWAEEHFTFIEDARGRHAEVDVLLGDARIVMEQQLQAGEAQRFDVLAVDAFSGDAIPIHLLTVESLKTYWQHLQPNGILAIHTSNRFVDLKPVIQSLALRFRKAAVLVESPQDAERGTDRASWILLTSNAAFVADQTGQSTSKGMPPAGPLWTDDFSSLYDVLDLGLK